MAPSTILVALIIACIFAIVKRLYFDPLSRYPGPKLWALTRLPYMLAFRNGTLAHKLREIHVTYGEVVRVAPNELSYIRPESIRDIYAKKPNSHFKALPKDPIRDPPPEPGTPVPLNAANDADHTRIRKVWSPSFSNQALSAQEPLINDYVTIMMDKLTEMAQRSDEPIDLQQWYSYCIFDIIIALVFGKDLQCMKSGRYHEWVALLVRAVKVLIQMASCRFYPLMYWLLLKMIPKRAREMRIKHEAFTKDRVQERLNMPSGRADFFSHFDKHKRGMTDDEITLNSKIIVFAGSHSLQTTVTGITLLLVKNPDVLQKVSAEVRSRFASEDAMDSKSLATLPYLGAVIQEGMRVVSPVPLGLTRMIPEGGATICGDWLPAKTIVSYQTLAANKSPLNYTEPREFLPERWLEQGQIKGQTRSKADFPHDRYDAQQPFSQGPRDCLGQYLAKVEILLILGRMLYRFDMSAPPQGTMEWEDQKTYLVWTRSELPVQLKLASRT